MTRLADRLQVLISIRTAFELRYLVIDLLGWPWSAVLKAGLAEAFVSAQDALAGLFPLGTVATALPAATMFVGKLADVAICLMLRAITCAISHQGAATRMAAGFGSSGRHE